MKKLIATTALAPCLAMALAACSAEAPEGEATAPEATENAVPDAGATTPASDAAAVKTIGLEGLGTLKIGQPVPEGSSWAKLGAQASDTCLLYKSPSYPGAYAIVEEGAVRRISIGEGSDVKLVEGIGVGSTRADVDANLPGFRETPHKYVEGGKYLTAPNAESGDPAVRFELGADGKVTEMHVGTMPVLGYVEGCA
ncbi:hypothetical protein [Croceicoccus bisphenolivorans]|uniref:hypothetical protein n=1 Tax=Croceicoccus bisphenolivorans TaxID=1783232 RepID=UPI00082FD39B|nr:hypothetical protein [Croceicoccus bisphenolivorans]